MSDSTLCLLLFTVLSYTLDHSSIAHAVAQVSCKRDIASLTVVRQVSLSQYFPQITQNEGSRVRQVRWYHDWTGRPCSPFDGTSEKIIQRIQKINASTKSLVERLCDIKINALSVLGCSGSISATADPYKAIPTNLLCVGSVCSLGLDLVVIHSISLAARYRTVACSNTLSQGLEKIQAARGYDFTPIFALSSDWEKSGKISHMVAEHVERHDEMAEYTQRVGEQAAELSVEERNLLSVAHRSAVGSRRAAWRIVTSVEQKEKTKGNEQQALYEREYVAKGEAEL